MAAPPIDDDLLDLFRTESGEQLDQLEQGLLQLEETGDDVDTLEEVRRQAHSLKGSARMLGLTAVERLAHGFEDALEEALDEGELATDRVQELYDAVDALREVTLAAIDGSGVDVDVDTVLERVAPEAASPQEPEASPAPREAPDQPAPHADGEPDEDQPPEEDGSQPEEDDGIGPDPMERARSHRIDTVRVDPDRLDDLMRHAGELTVTAQRLARLEDELASLAREAGKRGSGVSLAPTDQGGTATMARGEGTEALAEQLDDVAKRMKADTSRLGTLAESIQEGVEESRLMPMSTIFTLFPRAVRDLARDQDKEVALVVEGEDVRADKRVLEELKDPLMHLVRNAVGHGLESPDERRAAGKEPEGQLGIEARRTSKSVLLAVEDDGAGIDPDDVRSMARERGFRSEAELERLSDDEVVELVLAPGFSTAESVTDVSGRGVGMDAVAQSVAELDGDLSLSSEPGEGTRVEIEVPVRLSTARVILVEAGHNTYGVPVDAVDRIVGVSPDDIYPMGGSQTVQLDGGPVPVEPLDEALGLPASGSYPDNRPCVVLEGQSERFGVLVDGLAGEQEIVVTPLGGVLRDVRHVAGATVLDSGDVCVVLDAGDLERAVRDRQPGPQAPSPEQTEPEDPQATSLLLVEDTQMTRAQMKRILENADYEVVPAADGVDALAELERHDVDAIVSDIDMPKMDGIELTKRIREDPRTEDLPVILVTTRDSEEDKREGLEAGANAYIQKGRFDQSQLLETLGRLVG